MTPRDFVYWLRGYIELSGSTTMNEDQVKMIDKHLDLVFAMGGPGLYVHGDNYVDGSTKMMSCSYAPPSPSKLNKNVQYIRR